MVTFAIKNKFSDKLVYEYFLENHLDSKCGVISIIRKNRDITLEAAAEEDFVCKTSAKELNEMEKGNIPEKGTVVWY